MKNVQEAEFSTHLLFDYSTIIGKEILYQITKSKYQQATEFIPGQVSASTKRG
jgi:hypothetical protein